MAASSIKTLIVAGIVVAGLGSAAWINAIAQNAPRAAAPLSAADEVSALQQINATCAGCHGQNAAGGDRAPSLIDSTSLRKMDAAQIAAIITGGTPRGMPPFTNLPTAQVANIAAWIHSKNLTNAVQGTPEQVAAGETFFFGEGNCAGCHMVRGKGGSNGPDLSALAANLTPTEITGYLDNPTDRMGTKRTAACPGWAFCPDMQWTVINVRMRDGTSLRGFARAEAEHSLAVQSFDGKTHLLTAKDYEGYARETQSYMPSLKATPAQRSALVAYLGSLRGVPLGPLARAAGFSAADMDAAVRPKKGEWPSYNGGPDGNRYSALDQINGGNVSRLKAAWLFSPGGLGLETTPVVMDGIMYVTGAQQVCALDARTGLRIWCAPRVSGQSVRAGGAPIARPGAGAAASASPAAASRPFGGVASGVGPNRGVAVLGDRVFFETDDSYLVSVNRRTGGVVWVVPLTDPKFPGLYYSTVAPMIVGDLVVAGASGGGPGPRGFLVAFKASTGELAWRFWTIPTPDEPNAKTWKGNALRIGGTGGAGTWMTGSYDPDAKILYWGTANPLPSNDGDERQGRNLYANTILALDPKTGKLKWFYQPTPHDLHDWDATAPLALVDANYQGRPRKLLIQANRNGFLYVLDRITGQLLFAKPFVKKMNWASHIGADGMPVLLPDYAPTDEGHVKCPAVRGATNWFSTSYNPGTDLYYVMAAEDCGYYRKTGRQYGPNPDLKDPGKRFLRALNIHDGSLVWEKPLSGSHEANYSGVLSTAGGLVFGGETAGGFAAVDARTGKTLWSFPTNDSWRSSPMTYMLDGEQYVAAAAGGNIISFKLGER